MLQQSVLWLIFATAPQPAHQGASQNGLVMTFRSAVIDLSLVRLPTGPPAAIDEVCHEWLQVLLPMVDQLQLRIAVQLPPRSQPQHTPETYALLQTLHNVLEARRAAATDRPLFQPIEMRAAGTGEEPGDLYMMLLRQETDLHAPVSAGGSSRTWWCQPGKRAAEVSALDASDAGPPEVAIFVSLSASSALMQIAVSSAHWKEAGLHVIPLLDKKAEHTTAAAVTAHAQQLLMEFDYRTLSAGVQLHTPVQPFSPEMFAVFHESSGPLFLLADTSLLAELSDETTTQFWQFLQQRSAPLLLFSDADS